MSAHTFETRLNANGHPYMLCTRCGLTIDSDAPYADVEAAQAGGCVRTFRAFDEHGNEYTVTDIYSLASSDEIDIESSLTVSTGWASGDVSLTPTRALMPDERMQIRKGERLIDAWEKGRKR